MLTGSDHDATDGARAIKAHDDRIIVKANMPSMPLSAPCVIIPITFSTLTRFPLSS
jgi:hypothetical protein